jgi:ABC-2 type transport system permease protein
MRRILAFIRRDALVASSYRTGMLMSMGSLVTMVIPLYFIAKAIQPIFGETIASEGGAYFAFFIAGIASYQFVMTAVNAIPTVLASGIRTGTFEALVATPSRLSVLLAGMVAYPFLWTVLRALVLIGAGQLLGADFELTRILMALVIWALITLAYVPFGILGGAMLLVTRTTGPLPNAVLMASMFLGGVYFPTHVIPSWLHTVSQGMPLTYGLRALRQVLAADAPIGQVLPDLGILAGLAVVFSALAMLVLYAALGQARGAGTLALYL